MMLLILQQTTPRSRSEETGARCLDTDAVAVEPMTAQKPDAVGTEEPDGSDDEHSPIDYQPDHAVAWLRGGDLRDQDFECDVDIVLDGDDVELRLAATLEDVQEVAGRDMFNVTIGAKNLPDEPEADDE